MYEQVLIPLVVFEELAASKSPAVVQNWIQALPGWVKIYSTQPDLSKDLGELDAGEVAAILLAEKEDVDLLIIDDLLGRKVAKSRGINVTGLLGVLDEAAQRKLIDFPIAISLLQNTTFRASSSLVQPLLQKYKAE